VTDYRLGLIGAGNMAEAIVRGALAAKVLPAQNIAASDPKAERRELFEKQLGVATLQDNRTVVERSDAVILAVKPQVVGEVMPPLSDAFGPDKLLVSICAGVTLGRLADLCAEGVRLIRTMPNTPMLVGRGMVAMSRGPGATDDDLRLARDLFAACAAVVEVPEEKMDAVTAVSGSGPAYFFCLVEALIAAGQAVGLSPDEAATLAETTFAGAAELLSQSEHDAAELRRRVTSPGGTTEAALKSFGADGFPSTVARAVKAAADRSRELGK
jgi:pyrroline-5-carboxylate reductase